MDQHLFYDINQNQDDNMNEDQDIYTDINGLVEWKRYLTDKRNRFQSKDWTKWNYFWLYIDDKQLSVLLKEFYDISIAQILYNFCISVIVKDIANNKITIQIEEDISTLFLKEITIDKRQFNKEYQYIIGLKRNIISDVNYLDELFRQKEQKQYITAIKNYIIEHVLWDKQKDKHTVTKKLRKLFTELINTLNHKQQLNLLKADIQDEFSIGNIILNIETYLTLMNN